MTPAHREVRIPSAPDASDAAVRTLHPFHNARSALSAFLRSIQAGPSDVVLLPSYIGVSQREGSGVFDPIRETHVGYAFYRMDADLNIDVEDFQRKVRTLRPKVVILIHYFGWPDRAYPDVAHLAHEHGAIVMEDSAHAMLSDIIGGIVGRQGDASVWSLHKMLPVPDGGLLALNPSMEHLAHRLQVPAIPSAVDPLEFDLAHMAGQRREKASHLTEAVRRAVDGAVPLRDSLGPGVVPLNLPVRVRGVSRDALYESMNAAGFGVVSLYHTLIDEIQHDAFPDSHRLSREILNLPIHDAASIAELDELVLTLAEHIAGASQPEGAGND